MPHTFVYDSDSDTSLTANIIVTGEYEMMVAYSDLHSIITDILGTLRYNKEVAISDLFVLEQWVEHIPMNYYSFTDDEGEEFIDITSLIDSYKKNYFPPATFTTSIQNKEALTSVGAFLGWLYAVGKTVLDDSSQQEEEHPAPEEDENQCAPQVCDDENVCGGNADVCDEEEDLGEDCCCCAYVCCRRRCYPYSASSLCGAARGGQLSSTCCSNEEDIEGLAEEGLEKNPEKAFSEELDAVLEKFNKMLRHPNSGAMYSRIYYLR